MHLQACGVIFKPYLKWNSVVEMFDNFCGANSTLSYMLNLDALNIHLRDTWYWPIEHYRIGYWSNKNYWKGYIGLFNILYCDIWFDIDNICIGYWLIENIDSSAYCVDTQCTIQLSCVRYFICLLLKDDSWHAHVHHRD